MMKEVGWEKVACWSTKARKDRGKVTMEALWRPYRNSPTLFRTVQSGLENGF